ncbi:hypothetical protein FACS189429_1980 [Bacteroidia bacterium]|nr:hypothetical protein FACS189429_1980 [Bacteroidia bacterium]
MEKILQKIKNIRNIKGFSYENMADELKISISAYRKIENNETKLTVERLFQIAEILQTPVNKLLDSKLQNVFYRNNNKSGRFNSTCYDFDNYCHQENCDTTQKLIQILERENRHLREEIRFLQEMAKK